MRIYTANKCQGLRNHTSEILAQITFKRKATRVKKFCLMDQGNGIYIFINKLWLTEGIMPW